MIKFLYIPLIAILLSSCATNRSEDAYDYILDTPATLGQKIHYTLNAPIIIIDDEIGWGIEYEADIERFYPCNGTTSGLRLFLIESKNSHVHLKCDNKTINPFEIDGEKFILDLRSEFNESSEDILAVWRAQDFYDKIEAEEKAIGMAFHKLIQQQENKK